MEQKVKIHIAADWEEDQSAVNQLYKWNREINEKFDMSDDSELADLLDGDWACSVKAVVKNKIVESDVFVLVVGDDTISVRDGSCPLCENYRSFSGNCAHGRTADKRSFIEFECELAVEAEKKIVVIYKDAFIDKAKCPLAVRELGQHISVSEVEEEKLFML